MSSETLFLERVPTPIGAALLVTDEQDRLRALEWDDDVMRADRLIRLCEGGRLPSSARRSLEAYFACDLTAIDAVAVEMAGTPFQREVWAALRRIPAGRTLSYSALAAQLNRPRAVRAVGLANGANPIGIVVPCHRVIGADLSLTGYGGGLERKRWLLEHEGVRLPLRGF
jgi:methylated-DNA-[protein]-cysteine S-methyltransferase